MYTCTNTHTHVCMHACTHACTYTRVRAPTLKYTDYTKLNLKWAANGLGMDEDSNMKWKTWQLYSSGKRNVFRLHLIESRESFCQRRRGRSFHVDGLKTEKVR